MIHQQTKNLSKKPRFQHQKSPSKNTPHFQSYDTIIPEQTIEEQQIKNGNEMVFPSRWTVWIHKNSLSDWTIASYHKLLTISNVTELWNFLNNFNKINYMEYQFFIMKNDVIPIWESPENKKGGAASITVKISDPNLLKIWEDLCVLTINEQIYYDMSEINGISFNLKDDLTIIKIWNKNMDDDISKKLPECFINKYKLFSVSYRKNRATD